MQSTATRPHATTATTATACATSAPRQGDLLDILNNAARVSEADIRKAKKALKLWYPMSYNLWLEHNAQ